MLLESESTYVHKTSFSGIFGLVWIWGFFLPVNKQNLVCAIDWKFRTATPEVAYKVYPCDLRSELIPRAVRGKEVPAGLVQSRA